MSVLMARIDWAVVDAVAARELSLLCPPREHLAFLWLLLEEDVQEIERLQLSSEDLKPLYNGV